MQGKEFYEIQRKRYSEGKGNTIGGILVLNTYGDSEVHIPNKRKVLRFHIKAESQDLKIDYAITHMSKNLQDETSESEKGDEIVYLFTYGDGKDAGVSLRIGEQYYYFSPSSEGFISLYFDMGYKRSETHQSEVAAFCVLVDGRASEKEVLFASTNSMELSHILYSLEPTVKE